MSYSCDDGTLLRFKIDPHWRKYGQDQGTAKVGQRLPCTDSPTIVIRTSYNSILPYYNGKWTPYICPYIIASAAAVMLTRQEGGGKSPAHRHVFCAYTPPSLFRSLPSYENFVPGRREGRRERERIQYAYTRCGPSLCPSHA